MIADKSQESNEINEASWGPWRLDRQDQQVYREGVPRYCIDFVDLTSESLFGTLRKISNKPWADDLCLGGLVRVALALRNLFERTTKFSLFPGWDPLTPSTRIV